MSWDDLETRITRLIIEHCMREWRELSSVDAVVVGAGASGLTAAKYISDSGLKVVVLEKNLSFGGGIGGGGMLFHKVVVGEDAKPVLEDFGVRYTISEADKLYVIDAAELMAKLALGALNSGAKIIHGVTVEDVIFRRKPLAIHGVVIQWTPVKISGLHVDPLFIMSRAVVDATGHDAEVLNVASKKIPELRVQLKGEGAAHASVGDRLVVEEAGRVAPGLYATGMAVSALKGIPRMGPIFSGMLLSGKRVAEAVTRDLKSG